MSATPTASNKKAATPGAGTTGARRSTPAKTPTSTSSTTATTNAPTDRSPSRMAAQNGTHSTNGSSTPNTLNRTKSTRNSVPVSARAAARKPAVNDDQDDAKAELQAKLDEVQEKLNHSELAHEATLKKTAMVQAQLDEARKEQGMLEEQVHEQTEKNEELENEKRESLRARRELEQFYADGVKEREDARVREEEMQATLQKMKETMAQREMRDKSGSIDDDRRPSVSRGSSFRSGQSPHPEAAFAPPSSVQRSDSRSSSKLVMQKDKIIESLRLELAEAQIKLVELENKGGGRLHQLERDMYDVKIQNGRLMEENESFQLLLQEKTLSGDFAQSDFLRAPSNADGSSRPPSRNPRQQSTSLADELDGHDEPSELGLHEASENERRLQTEVNSMKDQNKALTLYINNIISRLLQHEQFEQILDKTPDLMAGPHLITRKHAADRQAASASANDDMPPPPPPKDKKAADHAEGSGGGLLSRAKSVMGGGPKSRPQSMLQPPTQTPAGHQNNENHNPSDPHTDPNTAPSIPLGRSHSSRLSHRRANSDWPAASVVTNMYRGPSPGFNGPLSPGLASPTKRNSFFGSVAANANTPPTSRHPSNPLAHTISESDIPEPTADSIAPDDTRPHPHRSSSLVAATDDVTHSSNPAMATSPPRSTTSSNDRDSRASIAGSASLFGSASGSGAVMHGSKPRPLRLVQDEKARKESESSAGAGNRGSWFAGWIGGGAGGAGGRTVSGEVPQTTQGQGS